MRWLEKQVLKGIPCFCKVGATITQGEQHIELFFQLGQITSMGPLQWIVLVKKLVEAGVISNHDVQKALQVMGRTHNEVFLTSGHSAMEIAPALTELGLVSCERLYAVVRQEVAEIVQDLLTWSADDIFFYDTTDDIQ